MRPALPVLIALAVAPAAAFAAMSGEEVLAEAARLPPHVPGQYRTSMTLLEVDGPAETKELADLLRSDSGNEEIRNSDSCEDPQGADSSAGTELVREILADQCVFEQFTVAGEAVTAVVQCPPDGGMPGRVKMSGRIGAENLDMLVTAEQRLPDKGTMRLKMRIKSERVGECT
jgi:hypothetical protein